MVCLGFFGCLPHNFFFNFFSLGEVQSFGRLFCHPVSPFFTSVIILDVILIYLTSHLLSYHLQFWGKIISNKWNRHEAVMFGKSQNSEFQKRCTSRAVFVSNQQHLELSVIWKMCRNQTWFVQNTVKHWCAANSTNSVVICLCLLLW